MRKKIKIVRTTNFKFLILLFLFGAICKTAFPQYPDWQWAKSLSSISADRGTSIIADNIGNTYTTGFFDLDSLMGTFVIKLDAAGDIVWTDSIYSLSPCFSFSITLDPFQNILITGWFEGSIDFDPGPGITTLSHNGAGACFILKLDSNGNFIWVKKTESTVLSSDFTGGNGISCDNSGNAIIVGRFQGTVDFDPGSGTHIVTATGAEDGFILKLDSSGNFIWAITIEGESVLSSITVDNLDNIYTAGNFSGTIDFDPGAGTYDLTASGTSAALVYKLDDAGNFVWARQFSGTGNYAAYAFSIGLDALHNVYTTGNFGLGTVDFDPGVGSYDLPSNGGFDIFISKLDSNGNFAWARSMGDINNEEGESIAVDAMGNSYTTGDIFGTVDFDAGIGTYYLTSAFRDIFVCKFDNAGNLAWAIKADGANQEMGYAITLDTIGNAYLTGEFTSPSVRFGSFTLLNADTSGFNSDAFIAKLENIITDISVTENSDQVFIYPNPFVHNLNIETNTFDFSEVNLYDVISKNIFHKQFVKAISFNTDELARGIYIYEVRNKNGIIKKGKVVKQ